MPQHDSCEPAVMRALQAAGWTILNQQIYIKRPDVGVLIDLEAVNADQTIYIEVKCFPTADTSLTNLSTSGRTTHESGRSEMACGRLMIFSSILTRAPTLHWYDEWKT